MNNPFRTLAPESVPPAVANRITQWRQFMFWTRVVTWVGVAVEYAVGPASLQWDEEFMFGLALMSLFGGRRRRWPNLVVVEFFAVSYLTLEEPNHYIPFALCLLLAGHAAFTTRIAFPVLYAVGIAGLLAGFTDGHYPDSAIIRMTMCVGVCLWGARLFRLWLEQLADDLSAGMNRLLDRGFGHSEAFMDLASNATSTLDLMIDNDPVVEALRARIHELETASQCAQIALQSVDEPSIDLSDPPSPSLVRPHFLSRAHGRVY